VSEKAERRQARQEVATYHEAKLAELVTHVADEIDRFRDGDLNPFDMCMTSRRSDWWERGAIKER
jgi:hypothetical protein